MFKNRQDALHPNKAVLTAIALAALSPALASAQGDPCALIDGDLPPDCAHPNAGTAVEMPAGENTELDRGRKPGEEGFQFVVDGTPLSGDDRVEDVIRRSDLQLEQASVQVKFDGLDAERRLALGIESDADRPGPGDMVRFQSRLNYPYYVTRGEVRLIDTTARGGPRTLAVIPIPENGRAETRLPNTPGDDDDLAVVYRVYDSAGRYDETAHIPVDETVDGTRGSDIYGAELGTDLAVRRQIPVRGGAVTVYGSDVPPNETVETLGTRVRSTQEGKFVLQRILPPGEHDIRVVVPGQKLDVTRRIEIPRGEWFYVGQAELTFSEDETLGRGALYADGKTAGGYRITGAIDTTEEEIGDLLTNLDEKDPRSLLDRLDPAEFYPVYGDDSTLVDNAPTDGRFYLKVEKGGNEFVWGNTRAELDETNYLRSERAMYGARLRLQSDALTSFGEPRTKVEAYAAQPSSLPQRDRFLGTGGSLYFLSRQDIKRGTEIVTIQIPDPGSRDRPGGQPRATEPRRGLRH